jgi:hypothetical protein
VARLNAAGVVLVLQHFVDVSLHAADGFLQQSKLKDLDLFLRIFVTARNGSSLHLGSSNTAILSILNSQFSFMQLLKS